jgi:hypothetical protein
MKLPSDVIIPEEKFTRYLLVKRDYDDKSQFLSNGGYYLDNYKLLINHIKDMIRINDAMEDKTDIYGTFYTVNGILPGTKEMSLNVSTIWLHRAIDDKFQFITLVPLRRK